MSNIKNNICYILVVQENHIEYKLKDGNFLNINLYEISLEYDIMNSETLLDAFLFDCQCALFLIDITNPDSIQPLKEIISFINEKEYPFLTKIIVNIRQI